MPFSWGEQGLHVADGMQEKNYAGIGGAAAGLINTGGDYRRDKERLQAAQTVDVPSTAPIESPDGETIIRQADYEQPSIEVTGGDTLSQIAVRHGTTVEALMAANPGLAEANRI